MKDGKASEEEPPAPLAVRLLTKNGATGGSSSGGGRGGGLAGAWAGGLFSSRSRRFWLPSSLWLTQLPPLRATTYLLYDYRSATESIPGTYISTSAASGNSDADSYYTGNAGSTAD